MRTRAGYVFILTLAAIAALALVLAAAFAVQQSVSSGTAHLLAQTRLESDLRTAQAHALHLLLTAPRGEDAIHAGGVIDPYADDLVFIERGDPLNVRGEPRRIEINGRILIIRLVAAEGLIALDGEDVRTARVFLEQTGHSPSEAARLAARFADYTDSDDLRRLGGAERRDYPAGRWPANRLLRSAREICAVLGWEETGFCAEDPRLMELYFNVTPEAVTNPRFIPDYVLGVLAPDERGRERLQQRYRDRQVRLFADLELPDWDGVYFDELGPASLGAEFLILTHEPQAGLLLVTRVRLTPADFAIPFQTMFDFAIGGSRIEREFSLENVDDLEAFPVSEPSAGRSGRA